LSLWHDDALVTQGAPMSPESRTSTPESEVPAWEQIEAGRYMPRRIRGSYRGRELG